MSRLIVELQVFDTTGSYTGTWIDITKDVIFSKMGDITQRLDNDNYNAGVLTNSSFSLSLSNEHGRYGEVLSANTLFQFSRNNSLVRVSWNPETYESFCGIAICGEYTPKQDNSVLFVGLLSDDSLSTDIRTQVAKFKVLGRESIFSKVESPYASLSNGDTFEEALYTILNQTAITNLVTVTSGNINVGTNQTIDDKTSWENTTVKEILDEILEASGSILYIDGDDLIIKGRTQTPTASVTLYGQASVDGLENIQSLKNIKSGINKMVNYWTWEDTSLVSQTGAVIDIQGVRKEEISYDFITNNTKREAILDYNLAEFNSPKEELEVTAIMTTANLALVPLEGVSIDYPTVYTASGDNEIPLYGVSFYGTAVYPIGEYAKIITTDTVYKIMGIKISVKKDLITFQLRQI